ncbi:MAG: branched-chain amino acid ABC transporter permease [Alphaproteobacteria bacterium]|nr:branched-chain amino acid ABC transporter permease [Alphaproteobacteria bacterium]MCZ6587734.1 branched-chain amino acid ABC transporter permease [Alphaproteobacteria bacterium]MCZ6590256.1 branched-chain amino acid ABC transporter permease [Alphaproteobacteria bacterium]
MIDILQLLIFGIVLGGIIALGAVGVSLLFGILRFAHFAHGDMMTLGAYLAFAFVAGLGWPLLAAFPLAVLLTVGVAVLIDQVLYRRLRRKAPVILLFSSFGVALMLRAIIELVWGPDTVVYDSAIQLPWRIAGLRIKPDHVTIVIGAIVLVTALHLFLQRTRTGKAMRAMADEPDLAQVTGINTERVVIWTWIIGSALAAAAGIFLALDTRLVPLLGWNLLLPVFAAAILGGIGRPYGAIFGGLVIGISTEMSTLAIAPVYKPAVAFTIILIMLIWRPTGLLRGR